MNADDNKDVRENSGVAAFSEHLIEVPIASAHGKQNSFDPPARRAQIKDSASVAMDAAPQPQIVPRRVKMQTTAVITQRPERMGINGFDD